MTVPKPAETDTNQLGMECVMKLHDETAENSNPLTLVKGGILLFC